MIDFNTIAQTALVNARSFLDQWVPGGKIVGTEYTVKNPTRADGSAGSFKINLSTGCWSDFATADRGGDLVSLYAYIHGIKNGEAAVQLSKILSCEQPVRPLEPQSNQPKPPDIWTLQKIVPENSPKLPVERRIKIDGVWIGYKITHYWPYKNQLGVILFYVVRYETPDGKETPQMTLWKNQDGKLKWRFKGVEGARPLYNLDKISHSPDAQIIVVEGEKKAEALQALFDEAVTPIVATCWVGGAPGVLKADWAPLLARNCILWPDNDDVGRKAMDDVMARVDATEFLVLKIPEDKPKKWDAADAILIDGWKFQEIIAFIKKNRIKIIPEPKQLPAPDAPTEELIPLPPADMPPIDTVPDVKVFPFLFLGFIGDHCYYLPNGTRQVMAIKRSQHGSGELLALAKLTFWENHYHSKSGPNWKQAADDLLRGTESVGIYDFDKQRGRGAWFDHGRSVLHLGDRLVVDGVEAGLTEIKTRFIYEAAVPLEHTKRPALSKLDANKLQQISDMLFWEKPLYSKLFTGWIVCACICGSLKYRPHLWLTSKPGAGKTFIIESIMRPILGEFALPLSSSTTEAGIRQTLNTDALAVLIDEFEGEDWQSQQRIQAILTLARQAFSDNGARITKGGQNHKAISFRIRSSFFMSSVGVNLYQHADKTRVSVISLDSPRDVPDKTKKQHWLELNKLITDTITDKWCESFRARVIKMIPTIRKNIEVFTGTVLDKIGNRRSGDQMAPLLAGAYLLVSDGVISSEAAQKWIDEQDWSDQKTVSENSDEKSCLELILGSCIPNALKPGEISIAELLNNVQNWVEAYAGENIETSPEVMSLKRYGIRLDRDEGIIYISDTNSKIAVLLKNSPWNKSWGQLLKRIPGAVSSQKRFHYSRSMATGIPWVQAMGEAEAETPAVSEDNQMGF
jgi:putative DNA primase/helicase